MVRRLEPGNDQFYGKCAWFCVTKNMAAIMINALTLNPSAFDL